jgi:nitrogen fixation NifU-like protein
VSHDLYGEILLDHYRLPRNHGRLENPTITVEGTNPLCGDELTLDLEFTGDHLTNISFSGRGCAISVAATSMLTELLKGKTIHEIEEWTGNFRTFIREGKAPDGVDMGDIQSLAGVAQLPVRVKCATLPWTTLEQGLVRYKGT